MWALPRGGTGVPDPTAITTFPVRLLGAVALVDGPGGEIYYAQTLEATVAYTRLAPDPVTNPLGLFIRHGSVRLGDNVSIQGTIITDGSSTGPDLTFDGQNIHLSSADLPPMVPRETCTRTATDGST